jgi:prefoldin subunit 5
MWGSIDRLEKQLEELEAEKEKRDKQLDFLTEQAQELNLGYNKS